MASKTVEEYATILGIEAEMLLSVVKKEDSSATLQSQLDDQMQSNLILNLISQLKSNNFPIANDMPDELLEAKAKLELLYHYEKHYLDMIKEYKEEIKFASSLQEDLRRERSQFFTQTLREVVQTLQVQEIDKNVASKWIEDLVDSYTKSIDLSSDLAKTHVVQIVSLFKEEAKQEVSKAKLDDLEHKFQKK